MEERFSVKIDVDKALGRIKIRGLIEYLPDAINEVHKMIRDVDKQKHADSVLDVPHNWAPMGEDEIIKVVTLQPTEKEYQDVVRDFKASIAGNNTNQTKDKGDYSIIQVTL